MHNSVEGSKRHLPPWMVQKAGANNVSNSDIVVETSCSEVKGDIFTEKAGNGTKENARVDQKRETLKRKSKLDAKCEVKRRRRNLSEHDGSDDNVVQKKKKEEEKKNGARSRDRVTKSSRKKHRNFEDPSHDSCVVNPVQASSDADDDLELTVEDLMVIAKQYVKDYEDKKRQETSVRQCESNWQFTAEGESRTTLDSHCENSKQTCSSRETPCDSIPTTTTSESITTSTFQTGHIAQEMLDLFLGPLLKKTIEIEKEQEKNKFVADSSEVTNQFTRQSKDDHVGEGKMVPMMKKRSTLKDKVAMFLD